MFRLSAFEWLALAAALLVCPAGSPFGAEPGAGSGASAPARSLFDRLDRNRDGYLSSAELEAEQAREGNWIAVDRDRDGRYSRAEFGLVGDGVTPPSAAAGGTRGPKKPE